MSAEEDRRQELAFMVDAILRTVNNIKENFHMYESATRAILNIAREGAAQPPQVAEAQPLVQTVSKRKALSTLSVDRKRLATKGSVTSLKAATLLVAFFLFLDQANALAAIKSVPTKVISKVAPNISKNPSLSPISPQILARLFKSPGSDKIVDALDKSHDFINNVVDFVKKARDLREKNKAKGAKVQPVEEIHDFEIENCLTYSGDPCQSECSRKGYKWKWCFVDSKLNWNYCQCEIKPSIKNFLRESKYGLKLRTWEQKMAKMIGTDKIWYLFGVTLGLGGLIIILFLLLLFRTCRHYRATKAAAARKRPATPPSAVSTPPSLSRKPSHKRCPRPPTPTIPRPRLNGIQKQKVNVVNKHLMDSLEILAKQNLVTEKFYNDQMKKMTNGGILSYADSPPLENKFYHQARTEAEQRMVMRNDLRNDLRDGGGNGTTPAQPPVHRAQRPEPPGYKKNDQQNENQTIIEAEVEIDNHRM